jgi:beta-lactamase class A
VGSAVALPVAILVGFVLAAGGAAFAAMPVHAQGSVLDIRGGPVADATVEMVAAANPVASAQTDSLGRFSVAGGHRLAAPDLVVTAPGFASARVPISSGVVVLHRLPLLEGRAQDEEGGSLAEATVQLSHDHGHRVWTTVADESGNFTIIGSIQPGTYHLTVSAAYHDTFRTVLELAYDERAHVTPIVVRQLSKVSLSSQPDGLTPLLDGGPLPGCEWTPCTAVIPAGPHVITAESELYVPWRQEIWPGKSESLALSSILARKTGTLSIAVAPVPGWVLRVDGSTIGASSWSGKLPTGDHLVEFTSARSWPYSNTVRVDWNEETAIGLPTVQIVPGDAAGFLSGLRAYLAGLGGSYGVYLEELRSGLELGYGDSDSMDAASVIKLPVALYVYHQVEAGAMKLEDGVELQDADFMEGTGLLYYRNHPGDSFTYGQLVQLLIQQSDNTAWRALLRVLGSDRVDGYAASLGARGCVQDADVCTARGAGHLLVQLAGGRALNPANTSALLGLLETTVFDDRINYFLPDIPIAHKVGMKGRAINDSGIVYLGANPFVISMFTDTDDPDTGAQAIRDVARAAAAFYGR